MDKKKMSERSIITQYIIPAIEKAGWDKKQIAEEVTFTDGKIIVRKKLVSRGNKKRADIILSYKSNSTNIPLAIIEAMEEMKK